MSDIQSRLREIPQVSAVLEDSRVAPLMTGRRQPWMTRLVQGQLEVLREDLKRDRGQVRQRAELLEEVIATLLRKRDELVRPSWTRVLNGTGVVVHTNLGRSCWPENALAAADQVGRHHSDLEFDLEQGVRGHRGRRVERKAALLAGSEDALIVNNNAAAVWLAVRYLSGGGRVVLSRGEVVAIGGSFRMHEILAETGCELIEVGTTNRTGLEDYRKALQPGATVIKVHRSNFTVEGFTEDVSVVDLAELCRQHGCPLVYDAGSGALHPYEDLGLPAGEALLSEDVAAGPELVTCSGDKLLGGCQAGMILGSARHIAGLRQHPMRRAFRVDKTTLAALDAVLSAYLDAPGIPAVPTLERLALTPDQLQDRAAALLERLVPGAPGSWKGSVVAGRSSVGGGTFSTASIESRLVQWTGPKDELEKCHQLLRGRNPALVGRMNQEGLAIDVRTLTEDEIPLVVEAFAAVWGDMGFEGGN